MGSTIATVAVLVLGLVVAQQAAAGTLRQWLAAKLFNVGAPPPAGVSSSPFSSGPPAADTGGKTVGRAKGTPALAAPVASPRVTSGFGMRTHPITGQRRHHDGVDLAGAVGDPVRAAAPGRVTWSGPRGGYGLLVEIDHGGGWATRYAHLSRAAVPVGATVETSQLIGHVGATGQVTGPHLHFELRRDGTPVDPAPAMVGVG